MPYDDESHVIDARDVLDVNARVRRGFVGVVLGHFRRIGPNAWDNYEYIESQDEEPIEVYPGIKIQLEPAGCDFRMRSMGKVLRVSWRSNQDEIDQPESTSGGARDRFMGHYVEAFDEKPGYGAAAVIADKLK